MSRLPEPSRPYPEMTPLEQRQYVESRLWHSRELHVCFVCESELELQPYEDAFICPTCRDELEAAEGGGPLAESSEE